MNSRSSGAVLAPPLYKAYLIGILSLLLAFNYVDRFAFGLLLQNIKASLSLSDLQLGVLTGIGFSLFYSTMGIPIGALADRGDRVKVITATMGIWAAMVAICGAARNFLQLLLIRVGVGVGESGCVPPSHSLIAEYFTRDERPRATAIYYAVGILLSNAVGFFGAGWLNQRFGWRTTFLLIGALGLILVLIARSTLTEPRRRITHSPDSPRTASAFDIGGTAIAPALRSLWNTKTFRNLLLAFAVASFFSYGILQWQPSFLIRSYGFRTNDLGVYLTIIYGGGGAAGMYLGGALASRFARHQERLQLSVMAALSVAFSALTTLIYFSTDYRVSFALMMLTSIAGSLITAPLFSTVQTLVHPRTRALAISLIYLAGNLLGMGFGPVAVGALSEVLHPMLGRESLRYALATMSPGYLWAGWHFWRASRTVMADIGSHGRLEANTALSG